jgi:hypothetical protein
MNPTSQKAKEVFLNLVKEPPSGQRDEHLQRVCAGDVDVERRVRDLLRAHAEPGSFLDCPAVAVESAVSYGPVAEQPGQTVGRYKLLEEIGEGGMGVVYTAEQREPIRRKVALKIIKPGMDTREVIARFEAERQALPCRIRTI